MREHGGQPLIYDSLIFTVFFIFCRATAYTEGKQRNGKFTRPQRADDQ